MHVLRQHAADARRAGARVVQAPCPLFVALAEEGWTDGPIAEAIASRYLAGVLREHPEADCLVLGCTHFPVLRAAISAVVGPRLTLVDSAETTARVVAAELTTRGLLHPAAAGQASCRFLATDAPARFARVGAVFMGEALAPALTSEAVELVDL